MNLFATFPKNAFINLMPENSARVNAWKMEAKPIFRPSDCTRVLLKSRFSDV